MKIKLPFLFLLLALNLTAQDLSVLFEQVKPAVVVILTAEKDVLATEKYKKTITSEGLGSGFLISSKQIITAAHVVQVAEDVLIRFHDGESIPGKVMTINKSADVALVELLWERKNPTIVSLGDSDKAKVGEQIFIIGAPYGLTYSFSSGYLSGKINKSRGKNPFTQTEYLQTDAAINTGNSGGPMFNMKGEVIGVVSNILTESGGFQGIGFAATSNITRKLLLEEKIIWTGVDGIPLTGRLARLFNIPQQSGFLVQKVASLSIFDLMGLEGGSTELRVGGQSIIAGGDIILEFNGIEFDVTDQALIELGKWATQLKPDDAFSIKILRGGKMMTLSKKPD